jgi:serine/threonine protein kinase
MAVQDKDQPAAGIRQKLFEPVLFGRYCLIDQISKGGMSDIYLARVGGAAGFQKPVVIKKLLPKYSSKQNFVKRFLNEAKTLARLNHSNVVQIYDMGMIDEEYYIALEYIEGRNVAHVVSKAVKTGRLPPLELVLHVALELAQGLAYAHRKRGESGESLMLVHQDINSFNVMVSYEAEVKIIDFGIAQIFLDKQEPEGHPVAGKLLYFSPEQLLRKPVDRRVDVYGTGVLMYELATGERLVDHQETVAQTVRSIVEMDVTEKVSKSEKIQDDLKPILIKAMAFDPGKRYSWMEEMIDDIRKVIRALDLDIDPSHLSKYMRELFHREILLDRRRLRKLASESVPSVVEGRDTREAPSSRELRQQDVSGLFNRGALTPSSWPFSNRTSHDTQRYTPPVRYVTFGKGKLIFGKGDSGADLVIILKGEVRILLTVGSTEQTLAVLREGDFFGESALAGEFQRPVTAVAQQDCELAFLDREAFAQLLPSELAMKIILNLVQKLRDCCSLLEGSLLEDSLSRLIFGLLHLQRKQDRLNGMEIDRSRLTDMFRLEDTEQVQKYLDKLETLNVVQADGTAVRIKNAEALESILQVLSGQGKFVPKL